ncbi:MAG: phytase [Candidatus Marinimicrobia bacterium]|nr:phytase [Candidatus Neomarinimicrobiota bacterium]MCH7763441.1 phytase [Candidatus Neomarinimicrobiota bacterium]
MKHIIWLLAILIVVSCRKNYTINDIVHPVTATMETTPVPSDDDAADDPCIWIHPTNPSLSTIIGTNKRENGGLLIYDLEGKEIQFVQDGRMNNVDIRYNFPLNGEYVSLVTAGNRRDNTISIYKVDPDSRQLENVAARILPLGLEEVYGSCMYYSVKTGQYYAFVNDKTGKIEQWELFDNGYGLVDGKLVRTLQVDSQPEGCVADDVHGVLYVGEEEQALWKFAAEPNAKTTKTLVDSVGNHFVPDLEGLTLYYANRNTGYLIASSQGNNTYVIYTRDGNNNYVGTFQIVDGENIDGVQETDGIDVTNFGLGPAFPNGVFVMQDGSNPGENQNYKCVPWESIANLFEPALIINTSWDPRLTK